MGNDMLRILMTICSLGMEWKDSSKIPVDDIIEEWRSQGERGRYEAAMWQAAGLEEMAATGGSSSGRAGGSGSGGGSSRADGVEEVEVDNAAAGGFFARWGREPRQQGLGEHAGIHL
jgi:hypothetical protein